MQTSPENWSDFYSDANHNKEYKIIISESDGSNSVEYGMSEIKNVSVEASILTSDKWVGRAISRKMSLSILASIGVPRMAKIDVYVRLVLNSVYTDYAPIGTFWVDERGKGRVWRSLTCYDAMMKAAQTFIDETLEFGNWPISMEDAVAEICTRIGVALDSRTTILTGADYAVPYTNDLTMREVLENIAAAHGGNWTITASGDLRLVALSSPLAIPEHSVGKNIKGFTDLGDAITISKVNLYDDADNSFSAGDDTGYALDIDCIYASQGIADALCNTVDGTLYGVSYIPFKATGVYLNPLAELGDTISINSITSVIMTMDPTLSKSFSCEISCPADEEVDHEYPYLTAIERQSNRTVKLNASYYGTTISRKSGIVIDKTDGETVSARAIFNSDTLALQALKDGVLTNSVYFDAALGKFVFDGELSATIINALSALISPSVYAQKATIAEITVDELDTSDKVNNYLNSDVSDDNFQRIYDQFHEFITAAVTDEGAGHTQATDRDGKLLYWLDENHEAASTTETAYPVYIYNYSETAKLKIGFETEPESGQYMPMIELGAGIGDGNKGKGFLYKGVSGLYLDYYNNNGDLRRILLGTDGIIITPYELKQLDFYSNGFSAKYSAETVSLTWAKDSNGRITALTTEDNITIPVNWNTGEM